MTSKTSVQKTIKHYENENQNSMDIPHLQTGETQYCKDVISLKLTSRFYAILIKNSEVFFFLVDDIILKFIWKYKGQRIDKTNVEKNKVRGRAQVQINTYYKVIVIKTA